ncbi:MAG: 2-hydroxyacyl-CoA dehydratase subunit D [Bacillota bacterium]
MRLGYFCSYTPEEILLAAGCQPVRLFPTCAPGDKAERHLQNFACGYARSALEYVLGGTMEGLDGVIIPAACDSMRAVAEILRLNFPARFVFFLNLPLRLDSPGAGQFYVSELTALKRALEKHTGRTVTAQRLADAMALTARFQAGLWQLWYGVKQTIAADVVPGIVPPAAEEAVSEQCGESAGGDDIDAGWPAVRRFALLQRWLSQDRQAALAELQQLLSELPAGAGEGATGGRVLAVGASLADAAWLEILEKGGLQVVGDDLCSGSRYFVSIQTPGLTGSESFPESSAAGPERERNLDALLTRLTARYINRVPCPTKYPSAKRQAFWQWLYRHCRPRGVVYFQNIYCEPHGFDFPHLKAWWGEKGLPLLRLDVEPGRPPGEAELTRVQAFAEMLGGGKA